MPNIKEGDKVISFNFNLLIASVKTVRAVNPQSLRLVDIHKDKWGERDADIYPRESPNRWRIYNKETTERIKALLADAERKRTEAYSLWDSLPQIIINEGD